MKTAAKKAKRTDGYKTAPAGILYRIKETKNDKTNKTNKTAAVFLCLK